MKTVILHAHVGLTLAGSSMQLSARQHPQHHRDLFGRGFVEGRRAEREGCERVAPRVYARVDGAETKPTPGGCRGEDNAAVPGRTGQISGMGGGGELSLEVDEPHVQQISAYCL